LFINVSDPYIAMGILNDLYFREKDRLENLNYELDKITIKVEQLIEDRNENYY